MEDGAKPPVFKWTVYVELVDGVDADALESEIQRVLCPHEADEDHPESCPVPWMIIGESLDEGEAEECRDLLNR